jgi:DNA-binding IclR family transcriptional regulator
MAAQDGAPQKAQAETAQTLHRGIRVLELLAASRDGLTVNEIAAALEVNRTVVYRLLATLTEHRLITRDDDGRTRLGLGVLELARQARPQLVEAAIPLLRKLADDVGATATLTVEDGGEALAVAVVEPRRTDFHVAYRVGSRHPLDRGAAGVAILAGRPSYDGEPADVTAARERGYAMTGGQLQPGAYGVAVSVGAGGGALEASVGVITLSQEGAESVVAQVIAAANAVAGLLG